MRRIALALLLLVGGCSLFGGEKQAETFAYDFDQGRQGWTADFTDYPVAEEEDLELIAELRPLPAPLDTTEGSFFLAGTNLSDDLFMFLKRRIANLRPSTNYRVSFTVTLATNEPYGCAGVGGAPGESVFVKAGAAAREPVPIVDDMDHYRLNVDKGNQATAGERSVVLGDMASSQPCEQEDIDYELKRLQSDEALTVRTNDQGAAWIFVGTDSGFEARTRVYYDTIRATFRPV